MALKLGDSKDVIGCLPEKTINSVKDSPKQHIIELLSIENKCINCDKIFDLRSDLSRHVKQFHSNAKAFKCINCNVLLMNMICLSHHMENHKESPTKYACKLCSKEFICNDEFNCHLKVHTEESPNSSSNVSIKKHACDYCSKSFDRLFNLRRHLRVHTGERPFSCTLCKKAYKEKCDLTNHQKFHILEKKLNGVLKGRLRTREGERPYSCSLCEKSYKEMRHLTRHQKTHEEEKTEKSENIVKCLKVNTRKRPLSTQCDVNDPLNIHKLNNGDDHSVGRCNKSLKSNVDQILHKLDIKEELYSDSDSLDDLEVKNLIEICKTEYISDEDVKNSAARLEEKSDTRSSQ